MASPTDVCNDAMMQIGEAPIANIDDGTLNADRCKMIYAPLVDDALRRHNWSCARFFQTLAPTTSPTTKWTAAYGLPGDPYCLAVRCLNNNPTAKWELAAGRLLLTKEATAHIEYTGRVADPTLWDATLYQAITIGLAAKLLAAIKHDYQASARMMGAYNAMFREGTYHSDLETLGYDFVGQDALIAVRGD